MSRSAFCKSLACGVVTMSVIALIAPKTAGAASLVIDDASVEGSIIFSMNDFEGGFFIDGVQRQIGLNNLQTFTVPESGALGAITHTFSGDWVTAGLVPTSGVIGFAEIGLIPSLQGLSDILTFAYTVSALGGHLTGTFASGDGLPLPVGATVVSEGTPFAFNNGNITASAVSDVNVIPLPAALPLFATGLGVLGLLGWRRKRKTVSTS